MGREAIVHAEVGGEAGEVKALLESGELILRGEIRRRFPRPLLEQVTVDGDALSFSCAGETARLQLGARLAQAWAIAIATPLPSLAAKLGLDRGARALLVGAVDDAALAEAIEGAVTEDGAAAAMVIARIDGMADLQGAGAIQAALGLPLWAIYPKGSSVACGDGEIRAFLRERGLRDTKSCAVSDRLTATRYSPARA